MNEVEPIAYDEFSFLPDNISEWNLTVAIPTVTRKRFRVAEGIELSALIWGDRAPELALLHGGGQNAHTFDTVALALERPLICVDLPGHGHSDGGPYGSAAISSHADLVATVLAASCDGPVPLIGMSLGGLTSILIADRYPALVSQLILIDITPGVTGSKVKHITDFVNGPQSFPDFDELLQRTIAFNPTRSVSSLRRGILHNAVQQADGGWVWRHQRHRDAPALETPPTENLWDVLERLTLPLTLIRGMASGSVVDDSDEVELHRRCPQVVVHHVAGAGHSVQGDAPVELARLLAQQCDE